MKTGKAHPQGVVCYLGVDVTPEMMLERYCRVAPPPPDKQAALLRLTTYCDALQAVKIGNLLSVNYSPEVLPVLVVEQEYFASVEPNRKLP